MNIIKADLKDILKNIFGHKVKLLEPEVRAKATVYDKDGNIKR
jgi:hypothetical protein